MPFISSDKGISEHPSLFKISIFCFIPGDISAGFETTVLVWTGWSRLVDFVLFFLVSLVFLSLDFFLCHSLYYNLLYKLWENSVYIYITLPC